MPISSGEFRDALRHFAAGVTVVTAQAGGQRYGMTVSAFVSVSAEPPLIAVLIDQRTLLNDLLSVPGAVFAVNILAHDQQHLSDRFAFEKEEDRFLEGDWQTAATGAPILADALVWLDCRLQTHQQAGSHILYIGEVQASQVNRGDEAPLVYWNRGYRHLQGC